MSSISSSDTPRADGIISALSRDVTISGETMTLLQTNAAINPGNSGDGGHIDTQAADPVLEGFLHRIDIHQADPQGGAATDVAVFQRPTGAEVLPS